MQIPATVIEHFNNEVANPENWLPNGNINWQQTLIAAQFSLYCLKSWGKDELNLMPLWLNQLGSQYSQFKPVTCLI